MNATAALPIVGVDLAKSVFQLAMAGRGWIQRRAPAQTSANLLQVADM